MNKPIRLSISVACSAVWLAAPAAAWAGMLNISNVPLFLSQTNQPNVLVIYDNSQSMDGTMSGMLVAGSDSSTRSNIARSALLSIIGNYRTAFNWGLETFGLSGRSTLYTTYAYYLGNANNMLFTNDCVNGMSATNGNLRCIGAPDNNNGFNFVTYGWSGDDPTINDVLYSGDVGNDFWAVAPTANSGTSYSFYNNHDTSTNWALGNFSNDTFGRGSNPMTFTRTDAGFLPTTTNDPNTTVTRQVYIKRAWGYGASITGSGSIVEPVAADSSSHYTRLQTALGAETNNSTSEIKNAATFTPLAGSIATARAYFGGTLSGQTSPIAYTCQKNFVMLATDGNPTGKTDGTQYDASQWASASTGQAYLDVYSQITGLRSTTYNGNTYDVQTYVIGLGDTVANPVSIAGLNQMASLGGTGTAYLVNNQAGLQTALKSISSNIVSKLAAAGSVALNSQSITAGSRIYQGRFSSSDWSGQLLSIAINTDGSTGAQQWDAGTVVSAQNYDTGRAIVTYKPSTGRGIPFRWPANAASPTSTELDAAQVTALNANPGTAVNDSLGQARLNYLRGSAANESPNGSSFRSRPTSKLGDLINSAPVWVGAPGSNLPDSGYNSFRTTYLNRTAMVYVGANDGMLHGFDAGTGTEKIAFVPSKVFSTLPQLTSSTYSHAYTVDGTPTVNDVYYSSAWHTVLLAGLGAGGKGVYALDVTDPSQFTEANASSLVLWEFTDSTDADMGVALSRPTIARVNSGAYVAIFGNGYNNTGTGQAVLYVVNIATGALIKKITTGVGNTTTPNGLSTPVAVDKDGNRTIDAVYAGDLQGNLWKFDLSDSNPANWAVAYTANGSPAPLYTAKDGSNVAQPITVTPDVGVHPSGGSMVYFGTGMYLQLSDVTTTQQQTIYGIWDNGAAVSSSDLVQQTVVGTTTVSGYQYRVVSSNTVNWASKKGWYLTLPTSGERSITDPFLRNGRLIFTSTIPSSGACTYGGTSWLMELDYLTGGNPSAPVFDVNGDSQMTSSDTVSVTASSTTITRYPAGRAIATIASAPAVQSGLGNSTKPAEMKYINQSSGTVTRVLESGSATGSHRSSWRQIR